MKEQSGEEVRSAPPFVYCACCGRSVWGPGPSRPRLHPKDHGGDMGGGPQVPDSGGNGERADAQTKERP